MASPQLHRLLAFTNADLGVMPSSQKQVSGAPVVVSHLPVRFMFGQIFYKVPPGTYVLPPLAPPTPQKSTRKRTTRLQNSKPYIKKPPNAFMLFMKEQRPFIQAEIINVGTLRKDSATVNKILGKMWKSLTLDEQEKYFKESERLNQIHASMYPDWSCRDNYGKKRKRECCRAATSLNMSAPQVPVQAQMPCTYTLPEELEADQVSTHLEEAMELAETCSSSSPFTSVPQVGPEEDLILTLLKNLGVIEATESDVASSTSSSSSTCTGSLHEGEEDLTSALFEELEALEAAEASSASFSSSSTCTNSLHEEDLTSTLFKELEALEAADAAEASSASFSSLSSCSTYCMQ